MQKKIIALAIAGLTSASAFAADNVTIYGRVDYGYVNQSGTSGGITTTDSKGSFGAGVEAGSRIGFKGAEDLGGGLKAVFEVEFGIGNDQVGGISGKGAVAGTTTNASTAAWVNRHSYVGLAGNFGTVVGGRLDGVRYGLFNKYDAFAGGTVGNFTQVTGQVDRADNAIAYISPNISGFTGLLAYSTNIYGAEAAGNHNDLVLNTFNLNYTNGPLSLDADYETVKSNKPAINTADASIKVITLAGSYDFGVAKVSALWDSHKQDNTNTLTGVNTQAVDYRDWFVSALVPVTGTAATVKATYGRVTNKLATLTDADITKFGLGLDYAFSKRTNLYVDYGRITNGNNAKAQISAAANAGTIGDGTGTIAGNGTLAAGSIGTLSGAGAQGFDIGIAHKF